MKWLNKRGKLTFKLRWIKIITGLALSLALLFPAQVGARVAEPPAPGGQTAQAQRRRPPHAAPSAPNPIVQGMLAQVSQPTLTAYLESLTGVRPIPVDGATYTLNSRYSMSAVPIQKATQYAYDVFQGLGLKTSFDPYMLQGKTPLRNVVAEQTGLTQPQRIFLLTAHIDSISNLNAAQTAPGADDNASGTAAVMQAAGILSQYDFGCTLRYVLFTGEEQGLYGSAAYAAEIRGRGENVEGVLNLDMLAYNTVDSEPTLELHTRKGSAADQALADQFISVVQTYAMNLTPLLLADSAHDSDHAAFWDQGYPAVLAIEDWSDHTPFYHRTTDRLSSLNLAYYTEMVKASVATMGQMGCLLDGQLSGLIQDEASQAPLPGVRVEAWQNGQPVDAAVSDSSGRYHLPLQAGLYTLKTAAAGYRAASLDAPGVSLGQETQQDLLLQPCATVQSPDFQFSPADLEPGQVISFSAWVGGGQEPVSYTWTFSDQTNAAGQQTSHVFASAGLYTVTLTADNECGYPQAVSRNLPVGLSVLYLPVERK